MPGIIHTHGFTGWQGQLVEAHRRAAVLPAQAGLDGHEVVKEGWSTDPATIVTSVEVADLAASRAKIESYRKAMEYTTGVDVTEPIGRVWTGVIVLDVRCSVAKTITGAIRITATWRLLPPTYRPA